MSERVSEFALLHNGDSVSYDSIGLARSDAFFAAILEGVDQGLRVASYFGIPGKPGDRTELVVVLADDYAGRLRVGRTEIAGSSFPSLSPQCTQVHLFEREIAEQTGLHPDGHPWLKPVRFARPMRPGPDIRGRDGGSQPVAGITDFFRIEGEEVHEVAVGPVHAGVIEPGHFRFQCHGEHVFHLEISLGYQYRGIEEAIRGGPYKVTARQMETIAGDTSIGHGWAYVQNLEALGGLRTSPRAQVIRGMALELERLANHTGDLGALAGDVGYLPTQSYCGRLRGDYLNMTALICGNRFGRSLLTPGGVRFDLDAEMVGELQRRLEATGREVAEAVELLWQSTSVMARFENIGTVSFEHCLDLGLVGPVARACGVERDIRSDHPLGIYQFTNIPAVTAHYGDVNSRAYVRWLEIQRSMGFLQERLAVLATDPEPPSESLPRRGNGAALAPGRLVCTLIEGWRGEICHVAITDADGKFLRYKITDPSFHNWFGLAIAMRDQQISDFPLCNKSFNLSYCGHDL